MNKLTQTIKAFIYPIIFSVLGVLVATGSWISITGKTALTYNEKLELAIFLAVLTVMAYMFSTWVYTIVNMLIVKIGKKNVSTEELKQEDPETYRDEKVVKTAGYTYIKNMDYISDSADRVRNEDLHDKLADAVMLENFNTNVLNTLEAIQHKKLKLKNKREKARRKHKNDKVEKFDEQLKVLEEHKALCNKLQVAIVQGQVQLAEELEEDRYMLYPKYDDKYLTYDRVLNYNTYYDNWISKIIPKSVYIFFMKHIRPWIFPVMSFAFSAYYGLKFIDGIPEDYQDPLKLIAMIVLIGLPTSVMLAGGMLFDHEHLSPSNFVKRFYEKFNKRHKKETKE